MKTVTFLNQKGGVGKTSCTLHVGAALALAGRRVLLIDADPQGSLTQGFLGSRAFDDLDPAGTIAAVLLGHDPYPDDVVRPTGAVAGLDLMPGSPAVLPVNVPEPWTLDQDAQRRLAALLGELAPRYDLCLIDCQPNFHGCSWVALVASDALVVPLQPEDFGAQGIAAVRSYADGVRATVNPGLRLAGYLLTMFRARAAVHKVYSETLRGLYGADVFEAVFPDSLDYKEAIARHQPISLYKPKGASAKAIKAIADELLVRLDCAIEPAATTEAA
mgnify:CR=1 FL=1